MLQNALSFWVIKVVKLVLQYIVICVTVINTMQLNYILQYNTIHVEIKNRT